MFFVTNNNKGSGLGLYIVKEAIDNLNGNIMVDSEFNIGSKFTVTIPKLYEN
jgi:signal transduction histidine kinase